MLAGFKDTLTNIVEVLKEDGLDTHYFEDEGRFLFRIDELMYDAGFSCNNIVLDVFFDEEEKVLFIGLLRFPKRFRRSGLGSKIVTAIKSYANKHHFFIYLDAWNESQSFWKRHGFKHVYTDKYNFEILGYSGDGFDIFHEWETFKKTKVFKTYLVCHE
ncbi:GNAT family N-acetyltransferase [Bacillus sp. Marseille-P3661]|uniref:GNAT family N-acetyltransferase n=1 Tax=Bacillus sp. Marseille-P3661 TaxID=1936234 RepID=UPI000C818302|nr:GNAT family N-acetyltransferase [Bacillus sp. Marseille-P3661]